MKLVWAAAIAGAALIIGPAAAQDDQGNQVKAGVDAWSNGDYKGAVAKWRPLAIAGDPDAQFNLGQAYKFGRGVPVDLAMAEDWYRRAALQGHARAEDNYGLALFEDNKRSDAAHWLEKSAARGEPRAQYVLGTMYFNGDAVTKDWVRAYALTVRASQSGLPKASENLALMDRYISLQDRQAGLTLARQYADQASRAPLPPADAVASTPPVRATPSGPKPETYGADATATVTRPLPKPAPRGSWRVQLGAFGDPNNARKLWGQVGSRFPGRQPYYVKTGNLTKLLVGPFASRGEAAGACGAVKPCVPVGP